MAKPAANRLLLVNVVQPGPFRGQELRNEVRNVLRRQLTKARRLFEQTTQYWATRIDFDERMSMSGGVVFIEVSTDHPLYYLLDVGAEEHTIDAYNYPTLVFRENYTSKTQPGVIDSQPSERSGDFQRKASVTHPGFEPRAFEEAIREEMEDEFIQETQEAVDNFARKSGHHMD